MTILDIIPNGHGFAADASPDACGDVTKAARVPHGIDGGGSAVVFEIKLPSGRLVYGKTSARMLAAAVLGFANADETDGSMRPLSGTH